MSNTKQAHGLYLCTNKHAGGGEGRGREEGEREGEGEGPVTIQQDRLGA